MLRKKMVAAKGWGEVEGRAHETLRGKTQTRGAPRLWWEGLRQSGGKSMVDRDQDICFGHIKLEKTIRYPSR